ncbi:hypothetical protein ElyMa_001031500 [Elysia marginata]|uniref:BESS domain-containing protein n=1 Tax=Elysia marginata TaxID=1093978 RepID=A0AAV4HL63_9GAST|nr:hypothetical protein ElyMa_001031500 [Elysia marginata]
MIKAVKTLTTTRRNVESRSSKSDVDYSDQSGSESDEGVTPQPGPSTSTDDTPLLGPSKAKKRRTDVTEGWKQVESGSDIETGGHQFDFRPKNRRQCGGNADPDEQSTALECFTALFSDDVAEHLITSMNSYKDVKTKMNKPAKQRSRYNNMEPVNLYLQF